MVPKDAKCAHVFRHVAAYGSAQRKSRDARCESAHESVLFRFWRAVNHIESFLQSRQQPRDFLGRMLQIVIHGHDHVIFSRANATKQGIMLTIVAH